MNFWDFTNWIFGFVGVALAVWFYLRPREIKKVVIGHSSLDAAAAIPERCLQPIYSFDGVVLRKVYFTTIYITNRGNKTVGADDFRSEFKIKMLAHSSPRVLSWEPAIPGASSGIEISLSDDQEWQVSWKHFDPKNSITIECYTDQFITSIQTDGDFSYDTKITSAELEWRKSNVMAVLAGVVATSAFLFWKPAYVAFVEQEVVDFRSPEWNHIPRVALFMAGFWVLILTMYWTVGKLRPGPRSIA